MSSANWIFDTKTHNYSYEFFNIACARALELFKVNVEENQNIYVKLTAELITSEHI